MKKGQKHYGSTFTEEVMKIHYQESKTMRQTADILGVTKSVVKGAISREHSRKRKSIKVLFLKE